MCGNSERRGTASLPLEPNGERRGSRGQPFSRAFTILRLCGRSLERLAVQQPAQKFASIRMPTTGVPVQPQKGPVWFRKMDRNADGDVSREFLGTKAEFDAIDTDHDDLISLEEAEAWDKKMREKDVKEEKK